MDLLFLTKKPILCVSISFVVERRELEQNTCYEFWRLRGVPGLWVECSIELLRVLTPKADTMHTQKRFLGWQNSKVWQNLMQ